MNSAARGPDSCALDGRTQAAELAASHRQPAAVDTSIVTRPPAWLIGAGAFATANRQGASRCTSVATKPFTRSVPERLCGAVFS
jgi:hypothetical protein